MGLKSIYMIVDATHADFEVAKAEAEAAQEKYRPGSNLSWRYNNDQTKVAVKIIGSGDWYKEIVWNGHPMILGVYSNDHGDGYEDVLMYRSILNEPEWKQEQDGEWFVENVEFQGSPQVGSPAE